MCLWARSSLQGGMPVVQLESGMIDNVLHVSNMEIRVDHQGPSCACKSSDNCHLIVPQTVTEGHQNAMPPQAVQRADGGDNQGGMSVRTSLGTKSRSSGVQANRLIVNSPLCHSKHSYLHDSAIRYLSILRQQNCKYCQCSGRVICKRSHTFMG